MANSYLPVGDVNLASWYSSFSTKMNTLYGTSLGFTAAELADIQNDSTALQNAVQYKEDLRQAAYSMTAVVQALKRSSTQTMLGSLPVVPALLPLPQNTLTGIFNRLATHVRRIKQHANYTTAIGQDLDIIPPPSTFNPATVKPVLNVRLSGGYPVLRWSREKADGIYLYVDRRDGNGFTLIDKFVRIEYVDIEPLPANTFTATWDYKARFMIDDDEIGVFSDIVTIQVIRV